MKNIIISVFTLVTLFSTALNGQTTKGKFMSDNAKIGISFSSFGSNSVFRVNELDGASSYDSKSFYSVGLIYVKGLNSFLEFETGLEYSNHKIMVNPGVDPGMDMTPRKAGFSLISVPATLRVNFLKYFFINGGLFLDIGVSSNSPIDSQTGLGAVFGIALKYDFDSDIGVFVNPYSKIHSLLPLADWSNHQRVWESGLRFGVTYKIK